MPRSNPGTAIGMEAVAGEAISAHSAKLIPATLPVWSWFSIAIVPCRSRS